ncbi:MAG: hypothetical protein WCG87_11260 [Bacteroidota bacterium]
MKKLICIVAAFLVMGTTSFAQTNTKQPPIKSTDGTPKKDTKAPVKATKPPATDATPTNTHVTRKESGGIPVKNPKMKKDGTPDMRYKENKVKNEMKEKEMKNAATKK